MAQFPERKKIRLSPPAYRQGTPFFITIGTYDRYPWFSLHSDLADWGIHLLMNMATNRATKLYAWCIMPDHIHLLLEDDDVVDFVRLFKGRMVTRASAIERQRRLWQRSFYDHALRKEESLNEIAAYIWKNPVRSGITEDAINYKWSGSAVWPDWRDFFGRG